MAERLDASRRNADTDIRGDVEQVNSLAARLNGLTAPAPAWMLRRCAIWRGVAIQKLAQLTGVLAMERLDDIIDKYHLSAADVRSSSAPRCIHCLSGRLVRPGRPSSRTAARRSRVRSLLAVSADCWRRATRSCPTIRTAWTSSHSIVWSDQRAASGRIDALWRRGTRVLHATCGRRRCGREHDDERGDRGGQPAGGRVVYRRGWRYRHGAGDRLAARRARRGRRQRDAIRGLGADRVSRGSTCSAPEASQSSRQLVVDQLNRLRTATSGVSIHEEAATLTREFQRAYEANARYFVTIETRRSRRSCRWWGWS